VLPGAAETVGNPGERQPRLFQRVPQRLWPDAFFGVVDDGRLAQILKDPGRGIDDDIVGVIVHVGVRPAALPSILEQPNSDEKASPLWW